MNFTEYLNYIYAKLECSQTELCEASGLSAPVISRYLSGDREPAVDSEQLKALTRGIHKIAETKQLYSEEFDYDNLLLKLSSAISLKIAVYNTFVAGFNKLIDSLNINMKELAAALNFDVSYLYRIKSGERHPVDLEHFCELIADYILVNKNSSDNNSALANLLATNSLDFQSPSLMKEKLMSFLLKPIQEDEDLPQMDSFLNKMEEFNLDEYIKVIHFDELKIPNIPFQLPNSKYYYGVENMRNAELDFLKATVLGKSKESVTMCSYMPMQEMAEDMDFGKKWMFGIAMMIKKGLHLNVIHNLDRPMNELMLGFEAWIPIYMTGQVSPYHIPDFSNEVFHQINYCSGNVALMGECIDNFYEDGRYYVTNNKSEISYFRKKTDALLKNAKPLIDIYTIENRDKFNDFLKKIPTVKGNRRIISPNLPDFTIPENLLERHLAALDEASDEKSKIFKYIGEVKSYAENILADNTISYDICDISQDEYDKNPLVLNFPSVFSNIEITLSYEEYIEHVNATKEYASTHKNFILNKVEAIPFNNIRITVVSENYFVITKAKTPNIHFVIYHPKMLAAMENFYLAYKE